MNLFITNKDYFAEWFGYDNRKIHQKAYSILAAYIKETHSIPLSLEFEFDKKKVKFFFENKDGEIYKFYAECYPGQSVDDLFIQLPTRYEFEQNICPVCKGQKCKVCKETGKLNL